MSAIAIVAICLLGTFSYCGLATYTYLRLLWYLNQRHVYDASVPAMFAALLLPLGLCMLVIHAHAGVTKQGLAPRSIRREAEIKAQREKIARLERELEIGR